MYIKYCTICLDKINKCGKNITLNECNHIFHKKCLEKWVIQNNSCPNCRTEVNLIENSYKIKCSENIDKNIYCLKNNCLKNNCNKDVFNHEIMPYLKFNIIIRLIILGITILLTCIVSSLSIGILNLVILNIFIKISNSNFNKIYTFIIGISETLLFYLIFKSIKYYKNNNKNNNQNNNEISI